MTSVKNCNGGIINLVKGERKAAVRLGSLFSLFEVSIPEV